MYHLYEKLSVAINRERIFYFLFYFAKMLKVKVTVKYLNLTTKCCKLYNMFKIKNKKKEFYCTFKNYFHLSIILFIFCSKFLQSFHLFFQHMTNAKLHVYVYFISLILTFFLFAYSFPFSLQNNKIIKQHQLSEQLKL